MSKDNVHYRAVTSQGIKILEEEIQVSAMKISILDLKFLPENPRVYACTFAEPTFSKMTEDEQQEYIFKQLCKEQSVKNLKPDIKKHGGLMENILVRYDTKHVIEGNSRLAVYRILHRDIPEDGWDTIQCNVVSSLEEEQQASYLNQVHVKGKTKWSAYEKANFAYARHDSGWSQKKIAEIFNESQPTISKRVKIIKSMKENDDNDQWHFSYYDVMVRNPDIAKGLNKHKQLKDFLFKKIRGFRQTDEGVEFTAQELRDKLPVVLNKPKHLKKFLSDEGYTLDYVYQLARISDVQAQVKKSREIVENIEFKEVSRLDKGELGAFKYEADKLRKAVEKISKMIAKVKQK